MGSGSDLSLRSVSRVFPHSVSNQPYPSYPAPFASLAVPASTQAGAVQSFQLPVFSDSRSAWRILLPASPIPRTALHLPALQRVALGLLPEFLPVPLLLFRFDSCSTSLQFG